MALFFLNYDLRKQRNYQPLYDELAKYNAVRILESMWCFKRINTNSEKLRDYFKQFIDADDGICVSEVNEWATFNTLGHPNQLP
ncbi:hypothetical protein [Aeromonas sp. FDAARGOS 1416]|uniref:hypothetical protein n=1 Tax=Aeromonas TaxID=642 RepID=UPI001C24D67A|nr:hypothetical protein [Aeromonas sp. FDAARGOS 1416]QXB02777.1 hypothetical protein I6L46_05290 [Aeromonas sp. FDAARGOS 1416]